MGFRDIDIFSCYESGIEDIIEDFYEPVLANAIQYDRIAGFFSSSSLAIASRGLYSLIKNGGRMRLITSPKLGIEDAKIIEDYVDELWKGDGVNKYDGPEAAKNMIKFKYSKNAGYGIAECWLICIRNDNYNCEIWIGDKNLNDRGAKQPVRPLYRIYPDPCNEYRN